MGLGLGARSFTSRFALLPALTPEAFKYHSKQKGILLTHYRRCEEKQREVKLMEIVEISTTAKGDFFQ